MSVWGVGARKSQEEGLPDNVSGDCVELGSEWEEVLLLHNPVHYEKLCTCVRRSAGT